MRDYKETISLPKTTFSLQGVKDEQEIRARFFDDAYAEMNAGNEPLFTLHDGPPYANGDIHMGHALNKVLKDFVVRSHHAMGYRVKYVPGWDCHGLPIEGQVERNLLEAKAATGEGKTKKEMSPMEFRQLCRDYAFGWIDRQRSQFKALGVVGDWENPYLTMSFANEAQIVRTLHTFLMSDMLYRGTKPVQWSTVEETALAEAEVEHHDLKVSSVYVRFYLDDPRYRDLTRSVVIWTTTPWTIPANRAVAFNPKVEYGVYKVMGHFEGAGVTATPQNGERLIMAKALVDKVMADLSVSQYKFEEDFDPVGAVCEHPLKGIDVGYDFPVPLIPGKHVTDDAGTGFVHTAPEHGPEDFVCWHENNMGEVPETVGPDGTYMPDVPLFAGRQVLRQTPKGDYIFEFANADMIKAMEGNHTLLASSKVVISYPHSWRSKAPLIYRNAPQWFMALDQVRPTALENLDGIDFLPPAGKTRLTAAVENRPDWLISRQRIWGTPMAIFVHRETGEPLLNDALNSRVAYIIAQEGGDAWWKYDVAHFFRGVATNPDDYEKVTDVLDVWFDSGCSHLFVGTEKADLYLEGSDQHRGWFGSSLLVNTALTDHAPMRAILTHGFVLDKNGKKMSKSVGNVVDPLVESAKYGTDVLRLWVALGDYTQDTRVGDQILKTTADQYKKLRNTLRFLVSNLEVNTEHETFSYDELEPLEKYMLHLLKCLEPEIERAYREYRFNDVCKMLLDFCTNDLSAFYFDIRKDVLYCDRPDSTRRRGCAAVMFLIFDQLAMWLKPILPYTTEEAWGHLDFFYENVTSNVLRRWKPLPHVMFNANEQQRWDIIREVLGHVTAALETERQAKMIGSPLEAHVIVQLEEHDRAAFNGIEAADVFRTSQATIDRFLPHETDRVRVTVKRAQGERCARSWRVVKDVGSDPRYPDLSARDADAVAFWDEQHGSV